LKDNFSKINHHNLLVALHSSLANDDILAVSKLHQYYDYNLRIIDRNQSLKQRMGPIAVNRLYLTNLALASILYKMNYFESALGKVNECIKIAQNKNDHATVLDCTVWLNQISGALGLHSSRQHELRLLEHILAQAHFMKKTYLFLSTLVNYCDILHKSERSPIDHPT
jgi:hypothetical protein